MCAAAEASQAHKASQAFRGYRDLRDPKAIEERKVSQVRRARKETKATKGQKARKCRNNIRDAPSVWDRMRYTAVVLKAAGRAVTNARFARLHGLPVGPVPFTTPPDPPLKSRARHGRHQIGPQSPLASVRGSARVVALPACRPRTEASSSAIGTNWRRNSPYGQLQF